MIRRNILFLIFFLTFPLSACSLKKQDIKTNNFQEEKKTLDNKIPKIIKKKEKNYLVKKSNIPVKTSNKIS